MKPFAFIQGWLTYPDQTFVVIGAQTKEQIVALGKKAKLSKEVIDALNELSPEIPAENFFAYHKQTKSSLFFLQSFEDSWEWWETLKQQLHHAVHQILGVNAGMSDEMEALAYAQEGLFRAIRRKLMGVVEFKKIILR